MRKPGKQKTKRHAVNYLGFGIPKSFNYDESGAAALWLKLTDGAKVLAKLVSSERVDDYRLKQELQGFTANPCYGGRRADAATR